MSAWVLKRESIANLAVSLAYAANNSRIGSVRAIKEAFKDCKDSYGDMAPEKLATALYKMNVDAVNTRYKRNDPTDALIFISWAKNYLKNDTVADLCQFLKSLQCFLYQCEEGDVPDRDTYKALEKFTHDLSACIVNKLPVYCEAIWG